MLPDCRSFCTKVRYVFADLLQANSNLSNASRFTTFPSLLYWRDAPKRAYKKTMRLRHLPSYAFPEQESAWNVRMSCAITSLKMRFGGAATRKPSNAKSKNFRQPNIFHVKMAEPSYVALYATRLSMSRTISSFLCHCMRTRFLGA